MPNHLHCIIGFDDLPLSKKNGQPTELSKIISAFKSSVFRKVKVLCTENGKQGLSATSELIKSHNTIWQKSFYDHIIRGEKDLNHIRHYIKNNPTNWHLDSLNPKTQKIKK